MNQTHLTDRIPEVVHATEAWTSEEQAHLDSCAECRAEWRLVSMVATAAPPAPTVDVEALSATVLDRLREDRGVIALDRRRSWRGWALGLAAAASLVLALGVWRPWRATETVIAATQGPALFPELEQLSESELETVLASIEPENTVEPIGSVPRVGDLSDTELEVLLEQVEGS